MLVVIVTFAACALFVFASVVAARVAALRIFGVRDLRLAAGSAPTWAHPSAPRATRFAVVVAGVVGAYVASFIFFFVGDLAGGVTTIDESSMRVSVSPEGAAAEAGMREGDRVVSVAGEPITNWDGMKVAIRRHAGEAIPVVLERDGRTTEISVTPPAEGPRAGRISIAPYRSVTAPRLDRLVASSVAEPVAVIRATLSGLVRSVTTDERVEVSSPVGVVRETAAMSAHNPAAIFRVAGALVAYFLWFVAILSLIATPRRRAAT